MDSVLLSRNETLVHLCFNPWGPGRTSVEERGRLGLELEHAFACNANVSCRKERSSSGGRGLLKVISQGDSCLPLTFHLAGTQFLWHTKWVLSTPHGYFYQHL